MLETLKLFSPDFIDKWQALIGSALGPFLAIILSAGGYLVKIWLQKKSKKREAIRRAEIAFSQTLSHINVAVKQLEDFLERSRSVVEEVRAINDPSLYMHLEPNFPATITILFDNELIRMRFRSYYVHNKILITDYLIRTVNGNIEQFRNDFERLLNRNERIINNRHMEPQDQRESYATDLSSFLDMVEKFITSLRTKQTQTIAQAKVYNLKLMKIHFLDFNPLWNKWKYEGVSLKYFRTRKAMKKYNGSMEAIHRIDALVELEAEKLMSEVRKRDDDGEVE